MITVNEIMNLTLFKKFKVLTGKEYLTNTVTTAVILEYESSRIHYAGYCYGYFVLVSYFFASTNPDLVHGTLKNLIEKHVSAIALKILPEEHIPQEIITLARKNHVPILTFYDEFMEDLIININESMKTRAQYIINEEKLNTIIHENKKEDEIERIAHEINPEFRHFAVCANLIPKNKSSNLQVHTYFDSLMYHRSKIEGTSSWSFIKHGHNIILLCTFTETELKTLHAFAYIKDVILQGGFNTADFYIGYDVQAVPLGKLNFCVQNATTAAKVCKFQKQDTLSYKYVGVYKYIATIISNRILCEEIKGKIAVLQEYDKAHEANLIKTLISFVENNGDFAATSEQCFQHTNTIRYRIKKAAQLLDLDDSTTNEELSLLVRCYHLLEG